MVLNLSVSWGLIVGCVNQNAPKLTRMALGLKVRSGRWFSLFHRPIYINYTVMVMAIYINLLVLTGYKWGYILIP